MDAERNQRIKRIFHEASSLDPGERMEFLSRACAGDAGLGEQVGEGGMGTVFRATDSRTGAHVALKLMHPHVAFSRRFEREVHLGQVIEHPNVVRTLDAGSVDGRPYLVMEFVEGKDLRGLYRELGTVPETLLREIAVQAVAGLEAILEQEKKERFHHMVGEAH